MSASRGKVVALMTMVLGKNVVKTTKKPILALPGLIRALERRDRQLLPPTIALIESLGSRARAAIPALKGLLEQSDPSVTSAATQALSKIDPEWMLKP